jgi:hypothetical protein
MPNTVLDSATCTDPLFNVNPRLNCVSYVSLQHLDFLVSFWKFSESQNENAALVAHRRRQYRALAGAHYVYGSSNYLLLSSGLQGLGDLPARTPQNAHQRPTSGGKMRDITVVPTSHDGYPNLTSRKWLSNRGVRTRGKLEDVRAGLAIGVAFSISLRIHSSRWCRVSCMCMFTIDGSVSMHAGPHTECGAVGQKGSHFSV